MTKFEDNLIKEIEIHIKELISGKRRPPKEGDYMYLAGGVNKTLLFKDGEWIEEKKETIDQVKENG